MRRTDRGKGLANACIGTHVPLPTLLVFRGPSGPFANQLAVAGRPERLRHSPFVPARRCAGAWGGGDFVEVHAELANDTAPFAAADAALYHAELVGGDPTVRLARARPDDGGERRPMSNSSFGQAWDAVSYDERMAVVTQLGAGVLDLLAPQPGERILDLGCGTGHHAAYLAAAGCEVEGIDAAPSMIDRARQLYPGIPFRMARGETFTVRQPVDAVFSNAALHWMPAADEVAARVFAALRPGGRFVGELGAKGNVARLVAALHGALAEHGVQQEALPAPWYFPSPAEYATVLEGAGFEVEVVHCFARDTWLEGPDALAEWYRIFAGDFLALVPDDRRAAVVARAVALAAPTQLRDGRWLADYRRLRFRARRPEPANALG